MGKASQKGRGDDIDWREKRQEGFDLFYKFHCETNDCSPDLAVERWICDEGGFDFEKRCVMALFHGATYAGPCESMFADRFPVLTKDTTGLQKFFRKEKRRLLFSPDCKYRKLVFEQFLASVGDSVAAYGTLGKFISDCFISHDRKANYARLKQQCHGSWFHWGRMGHWCFSEALERLTDAPIEPPDMEFRDGASHRSGWAFCIGRDDLTEGRVKPKEMRMLEETASAYLGETSFKRSGRFTLETACCNYKRQHKGSRYAGCYIDEQYAETVQMMQDWPEYEWLWELYLKGRQAVIPHSLLFEMSSDEGPAYRKDWNRSMQQYGRMPRVEAWANNTRQRWCRLEEACGL